MNHMTIKKLQKENGLTELQNMINSGLCWKMEGHVGRTAMAALESGACMLPKMRRIDYYGSRVPSRYDVKPGTTGSYQLSIRFWSENN